jgi:HEAT repeat protein
VSELDVLLDRLATDREWDRHRALQTLRAEGASPDIVAAIVRALDARDPARRSGARAALAALAHPDSPARTDALAALTGALSDPSHDLRILAASALGESANPEAVDPLLAALEDEDANVVAAAADALGVLAHPAAIEPLAALVPHDDFWVNVAAVVALGQHRDRRALPALDRAASVGGTEVAVAEASQRINHPAALPILERVRETAPEAALVAAGVILSSHPDAATPAWVLETAAQHEGWLTDRLVQEDDPAVARLLGLLATPSALHALMALAVPPRRSEAALAGILAAPPTVRAEAILHRVEELEVEDQVSLLSLLPPLEVDDLAARMVPLLGHGSSRIRSAAAEALARSPAPRSMAHLVRALEQRPVPPEVVRAMGGLGAAACFALLPLLADPSPGVRAAAADALARCAASGVDTELRAALARETDAQARRSLLLALARVAGADAVPDLLQALEDPDPETRTVVIEGLGMTGDASVVEPLAALLDGPAYQRLAAIDALGCLDLGEAAAVLERVLQSPDTEVRRAAARALLPLAPRLSPGTVARLASDPDARVRSWAVRMVRLNEPGERDRIEEIAARDPDAAVRAEALRVLEPDA